MRSAYLNALRASLISCCCLASPLIFGVEANPKPNQLELWVTQDPTQLPKANIASSHIHSNLNSARDFVRPYLKSQTGDIIINIIGEQHLQAPFILQPEDSGTGPFKVIYQGGTLSGGENITGWQAYKSVAGKMIYQAPIQSQTARQLYVNGNRAQRAKTTQYPIGYFPSYTPQKSSLNGILYQPDIITGTSANQWSQPDQIEAVGQTMWRMFRIPVKSVEQPAADGQGLITLQPTAWDNANLSTQQSLGIFFPNIFSFWQVAYFENAIEFLDEPGEWFISQQDSKLYYMPREGEYLIDPPSGKSLATVTLPVIEQLVVGQGSINSPLQNIILKDITFTYATWNGPDQDHGYVSDQTGFYVTGTNAKNITNHVMAPQPTLANIEFNYTHNTQLINNHFEHLGGVAVAFKGGSSNNTVSNNQFTDIASSAIVLGSINSNDYLPTSTAHLTLGNSISSNNITGIGKDYVDAAAIVATFTRGTQITSNTITDVPWSGISIGWGWGLMDPERFPGILGLSWSKYIWGKPFQYHQDEKNKPIIPVGNSVIKNNTITNFLNVLIDGGAIYTTGQQANSMDEALQITANTAQDKPQKNGGNTYYLDGGSRYIKLSKNQSANNPVGNMYLGPKGEGNIYYAYWISFLDKYPYGNDTGGCKPYGDIYFDGTNQWSNGVPSKPFFDICPYESKVVKSGEHFPQDLLCNTKKGVVACPLPKQKSKLTSALNRVNDSDDQAMKARVTQHQSH